MNRVQALRGHLRSASTAISRAVCYSAKGPVGKVLGVREYALVDLSPESVLVRILAAPVNPADVNIIEGRGLLDYLLVLACLLARPKGATTDRTSQHLTILFAFWCSIQR